MRTPNGAGAPALPTGSTVSLSRDDSRLVVLND